MSSITESINLIRYLIVVRTRHTLVTLSPNFTQELSAVWGKLVTELLPTREAAKWHKTRELWERAYGPPSSNRQEEDFAITNTPTSPWPIEAVLLPYTVKACFGQDEPIVWELKLLGNAADHGLFLEQLLPALELAATQPQPGESKGFWGQFRIEAIYAAHGPRWRPFVVEGKLDLRRRRPTPTQWAEGLKFSPEEGTAFRQLTWFTPFDLGVRPTPPLRPRSQRERAIAAHDVPTLEGMLRALMARVAHIQPGKPVTEEEVWAWLPSEEQAALWETLNRLRERPQHRKYELAPPPAGAYGAWIGTETFTAPIPGNLIPYLELASILQIGHFTHFGCGTFGLR